MSTLMLLGAGMGSPPKAQETTISTSPNVENAEMAGPVNTAGIMPVAVNRTGGLQPHNTAPHVVESRRGIITDEASAISGMNAQDERYSRNGSAPALEAAGRWGHGSLEYVESIEPAFPYEPFKNVYFAAGAHTVQNDARTDVTGARNPTTEGDASTLASNNAAAREARNAAYSALLGR